MTGKLSYEFPSERKNVIELVRAIPSNWSWVDGYLYATKELYSSDRVAENTRLLISRFYSINPNIVGTDDVPFEEQDLRRERKPRSNPKITDIVLRHKLFSSILFDEAAFETPEISIETVKELAEGFIGMGYKGWIHSYSGYRDNNKFANPERYYFNHDYQGSPASVSVEWDEGNGGKKENLEGILKIIQSLSLKELKEIEV